MHANPTDGTGGGLGGGGILGTVEVGPISRHGAEGVAGVGQLLGIEGQALGAPMLLKEQHRVNDVVLLLLELLQEGLVAVVLDAAAGLAVGAVQLALGDGLAPELDGPASLLLQLGAFLSRVPGGEEFLVGLVRDDRARGRWCKHHRLSSCRGRTGRPIGAARNVYRLH